jgi:hypothetical protein
MLHKETAMHATVRRYEGVTDPAEAARRVSESFVPLIEQMPGLVAYHFVDAGGGLMISTTVFEDREGAEESNRRAASWAQENLRDLFPQPPQISVGEVVASKR